MPMTPENVLRDYASGRIAFTLDDVLADTGITLETAEEVLDVMVSTGEIRRIVGGRIIYTWEGIL